MRRPSGMEPAGAPRSAGGLAPELLAERRLEGRLERDLRVPEDLACWPGHFPAWAVVPGALQLDWVMSGLVRLLGEEVRLERIEALKFKRPLEPGHRATLAIDREPDGGFGFRIAGAGVVYSAGRLRVAGGRTGQP